MPWSLKALDEKVPCHLASLSGELLEAIVRAAVSKSDVIDLEEMEQEVEDLMKPFGQFFLLLEIAQREVMRVNTFKLSEWFAHHSSESFESRGQDEEERERKRERWLGRMRKMLKNGHIVEHLEINPLNDLEGGYFDLEARRLELRPPPLCVWTRGYFASLHQRFPKLKSLSIIVKTCQYKKEKEKFWRIVNDDVHGYNSTEAEYKTFLGSLSKNEVLIRVQMFLAFAGSFHLQGLKKKTAWSGPSKCITMDGTP